PRPPTPALDARRTTPPPPGGGGGGGGGGTSSRQPKFSPFPQQQHRWGKKQGEGRFCPGVPSSQMRPLTPTLSPAQARGRGRSSSGTHASPRMAIPTISAILPVRRGSQRSARGLAAPRARSSAG